ncbi:tetratricopeptide repeat protein [Polyangium sorediatum]|uniref:Tetratricopeptide repeat protein n=1 Tax=Polyangium sorediatum TaxID=889274 RepID=A0ABT6P0J0_9BACT|nr:tetratricopeptide repeat protein [Polyangium sorediatum]MDI1434127.1 tetratricopeptide repeat protein [Polyangium sorediatum]
MKIRTKILWFVGALMLAGAPACDEGPKGPAQEHLKKGDELLAASDYTKAAEEYGKSLAADPKQEKVWEKKAFSHKEAGDMAAAEAAILKTLDFKPDAAKKAEVYANLAGIYMSKNETDSAEKNFVEAIKLNPNDLGSLKWMGELAARKGGARDMKAPPVEEHLKKAAEWYDKAIAADPADSGTYVNKRIVIGKLMEHERLQKEAATKEGEEAVAAKDKAKEDAAKANADKHQAQMDEYKKQLDELGKKIGELMKAAKK